LARPPKGTRKKKSLDADARRAPTVWSARRANLSASILIPVWVERMAALLSDRTTSVGLRHRGGLEVS
jgi:hypothetical protein